MYGKYKFGMQDMTKCENYELNSSKLNMYEPKTVNFRISNLNFLPVHYTDLRI